jgi:hypothetical protein
MAIVYTKTDQKLTDAIGTGAPVHTAVAGDRYTDTVNGNAYQYTNVWNLMRLTATIEQTFIDSLTVSSISSVYEPKTYSNPFIL